MSELVKLESSSPNSPIFASIVVNVLLIYLLNLMMSDLLDLLDQLDMDLLSSIILFFSLYVFMIAFCKMRLWVTFLATLEEFIYSSNYYHKASCIQLVPISTILIKCPYFRRWLAHH